jgi:hypothetical protein
MAGKIYKSKTYKKGPDTIRVSVMDDGTIKADNDGISMPNHSNADNAYRAIANLCGAVWAVFSKHKMPAVETRHTNKERS